MHTIISKTTPTLMQLSSAIADLSDKQYSKSLSILNGSSIGGHVRHVIELFQCLLQATNTGFLNYDNRNRNKEIEQHVSTATAAIEDICRDLVKPNLELILQGSFSEEDIVNDAVVTNYYREIIYNIEHCIHHMALIRIGFTAVEKKPLPASFGVAPSTIKYQQACAQ
jgi:hypothetical protein